MPGPFLVFLCPRSGRMTGRSDGCLQRGRDKTASATVYLMEELGDARLRCDQLMRYIDEATQLIEKSPQKDYLFEVAGHLIQGVPETAFKLQKALQAVALASARIDYEEIKQELRPEKVEELERVLKDVRIRPVKHRSEIPMKPKEAAARLREFSKITREEGSLPLTELAGLITQLGGRALKANTSASVADTIDRIATMLETSPKNVSRQQLASLLYRMAAESEVESALRLASKDDVNDKTALDENGMPVRFENIRSQAITATRAAQAGRWRQALMSLVFIVDEIGTILVSLGSMDTQKSEALKREIRQVLPQAARNIEEMGAGEAMVLASSDDPHWIKARYAGKASDGTPFKKGDDILYYPRTKRILVGPKAEQAYRELESQLQDEAFHNMMASDFGQESIDAGEEAKRSRFEQGKPADPTQNMDPEDAQKWKAENDEHKDNFKQAKRDTHLAGKPGKTKCGEQAHSDTLVDSVKDTTCYYCKQAWEKDHDKSAFGPDGNTLSKFEQGKPADPTENMSPEDAKRWKAENDEHKDQFKAAGADRSLVKAIKGLMQEKGKILE